MLSALVLCLKIIFVFPCFTIFFFFLFFFLFCFRSSRCLAKCCMFYAMYMWFIMHACERDFHFFFALFASLLSISISLSHIFLFLSLFYWFLVSLGSCLATMFNRLCPQLNFYVFFVVGNWSLFLFSFSCSSWACLN